MHIFLTYIDDTRNIDNLPTNEAHVFRLIFLPARYVAEGLEINLCIDNGSVCVSVWRRCSLSHPTYIDIEITSESFQPEECPD